MNAKNRNSLNSYIGDKVGKTTINEIEIFIEMLRKKLCLHVATNVKMVLNFLYFVWLFHLL